MRAVVSCVVARRVEGITGAPGRFARNISVATRVALVIVLVALVSLVVTSLLGLERGRRLAEDEIRARLSAVGAARAEQVERYVAFLERSVVAQALTPRPARAIDAFSELFRELDAEPASRRDQAAVEEYYRDVVAPELSEARDRPVTPTSLTPVSSAAITLQADYVVPQADGEAAPGAPPDWAEIHDPLDDAFQDFVLRVGLDDFYLIEPELHVVLYSTAKDVDFATSLRAGPYSGSALATLIDEVAEEPVPGQVALRDFTQYGPAGDRPSAFIASPVFLDGELAGFVAGRFGPTELTGIMTNEQAWGSLGDAGETYVVAADDRMRSDSRTFLEDERSYFEQVEEAGTATDDEIRSMEFFDTTVLFQPVDYRQVDAAFEGDADVVEATNYLGQDVLSSRRVLSIEDVDWAVFAEADVGEIRAPIDDFVRNLLVTIAVFIVIVTFFAVRWADRLLEPLRVISARLRAIRDGGAATARTELPEGSADEFVELAADIDTTLVSLQERTATAQRRADERRSVLRRLLPASIADRAEAGDRDVVEQVATATVAVIVIGGLGTLVTAGSDERARGMLDRFVDEADDLAAERGLDRVQLTGDAYVAACGVSRPHLDHAARTAAFVFDVCDVLRDLDPDGDLYVRVGLDVGPLTIGLTGGSRLIHDTWGVTVQRANDLARSAGPGQILVTEACRSALPAGFDFESTDDDDVSVLHAVVTENGAGA